MLRDATSIFYLQDCDYIVSPIYEWKFSPFINTGIQEGLLLTSNHNFLRNDRLAMEDRMCQCFTWGGYLHILAAWLLTLEHYHKVTTIFFPLHDLSPCLWELHWVTPRFLSLWKVTKSPTSKILGNGDVFLVIALWTRLEQSRYTNAFWASCLARCCHAKIISQGCVGPPRLRALQNVPHTTDYIGSERGACPRPIATARTLPLGMRCSSP